MGKSAKAKKEKRQSFQKPKLKVGKTKPKADNFTDTSFKSRSINVLQQSLTTSAPSATAQFSHHLALLNHKSDSQRRDSLSHLTSALNSLGALPLPASAILPKVQPLLLDSSGAVRSQCIKFLEALPATAVRDNVNTLILYNRAALTHLSPRVRQTGVDTLEWLLNVAGPQLVTAPSGWTKTLPCLLGLLGWTGQKPAVSKIVNKGWTSAGADLSRGVKSDDETKSQIRQMQVLSLLLETGLVDKEAARREEERVARMRAQWPLWEWDRHKIPRQSNPYAYLNLFGEMGADSSEVCPDVEDRQRVFGIYREEVTKGVDRAKREAGGVGRAAVSVEKALRSVVVDVG